MGNQGLASDSGPEMGPYSDSEPILGVTEWLRVRVHIDPAVCDLAVVSSHPGWA